MKSLSVRTLLSLTLLLSVSNALAMEFDAKGGVPLYIASSSEKGLLEDVPVLPWGVSAVTGTTIGWYLGSTGLARGFVEGMFSGDPKLVAGAVLTVIGTYYAAIQAKTIRESVLPAKFNTPKVAAQCLVTAGLFGVAAAVKNFK